MLRNNDCLKMDLPSYGWWITCGFLFILTPSGTWDYMLEHGPFIVSHLSLHILIPGAYYLPRSYIYNSSFRWCKNIGFAQASCNEITGYLSYKQKVWGKKVLHIFSISHTLSRKCEILHYYANMPTLLWCQLRLLVISNYKCKNPPVLGHP